MYLKTMMIQSLSANYKVRFSELIEQKMLKKSASKSRMASGRASKDKIRPISAVFDLSKKKKPDDSQISIVSLPTDDSSSTGAFQKRSNSLHTQI